VARLAVCLKIQKPLNWLQYEKIYFGAVETTPFPSVQSIKKVADCRLAKPIKTKRLKVKASTARW